MTLSEQQLKELTKLLTVVRDDDQKIAVLQEIVKCQEHIIRQKDGEYAHLARRAKSMMISLDKRETEVKELPKSTLNPDGVSRACNCGARHSMFPDTHMSWCGMREWK